MKLVYVCVCVCNNSMRVCVERERVVHVNHVNNIMPVCWLMTHGTCFIKPNCIVAFY